MICLARTMLLLLLLRPLVLPASGMHRCSAQSARRARGTCLTRAYGSAWDNSKGGQDAVAAAAPKEFVKRKMAMVVSYVGSAYYGLQMDVNSTHLPTVELQLTTALRKIGCIREENSRELSKIQWSRSSRTDKGVHAAKMVVSAKLEIKLDWLKGADLRAPELVRLVNMELPADIRLLSASKVNQGFRARDAANWRAYTYYLPVRMLAPAGGEEQRYSEQEEQQMLQRLSSILRQFEGSHSFHNFHRLSAKDVLESRPGGSKEQGGGRVGGGGEEEEEEEEREEEEAVVAPRSREDHLRIFDGWREGAQKRVIAARTRTVVYTCRAAGVLTLPGGLRAVRIDVRGQSFLLNQIRLIIGAAVAAFRGTMPSSTIPLGLLCDDFIPLPMAPSEGLVLSSTGFGYNSNGQPVVMTAAEKHAADDFVLLSEQEEQHSNAFLTDRIQRQLGSDWTRDGCALVDKWVSNADTRYRVPPALAARWEELAQELRDSDERERRTVKERELERVAREAASLRAEIAERGGRGVRVRPHKKLLPNTATTALAVRFQVLPSRLLNDVLHAAASEVLEGGPVSGLGPEQLAETIERRGGLEVWSRRDRSPHIE